MTAFCVGNNTSLGDTPPKSAALDLFEISSFKDKLVVTSKVFALSASSDDISDVFAFAFILADKLSVSFPILLLSIAVVSVIFNLVSKDESAYIFFTYLMVSVKFILVNKAESAQICFVYFVVSDAYNLRSNAACVAVLMGLVRSVVLFNLSKAIAVLKADKLIVPVPPRATGTTPVIFSASTLFAYCA